MITLYYTCVNEDGYVYRMTTDPDEAGKLLADYPNDMVIVTTQKRFKLYDVVEIK